MTKPIYITLILLALQITGCAQEYFFEFLPGWQSITTVEQDTSYISIGLTDDGIGLNHYQFSNISLGGSINDSWEFDLDTVQNISSFYNNSVSTFGGSNFLSGTLIGESSNRFYGTLLKFDDTFSDTLYFNTLNIQPGNGTIILNHLEINDSTFILGLFLQNTSFLDYASLIQTDTLGVIQWQKNFYCGNDCKLQSLPYN